MKPGPEEIGPQAHRRAATGPRRVLSLDGGGTKGFYTLGVLQELERMLSGPLSTHFDLIYGTSSGAFTGAMLGLGHTVEQVHDFYRNHIVDVLGHRAALHRSAALRQMCQWAFGDLRAGDFKTGIGIVCSDWRIDRPVIFRANPRGVQAWTGAEDWGCSIAEAVEASCSAYPLFSRVQLRAPIETELIDGGYAANNPVILALGDALERLGGDRRNLRLVSVGVGVYPPAGGGGARGLIRRVEGVRLLEKMVAMQTQLAEETRRIAFPDLPAVRIDDHFFREELEIDLTTTDRNILEMLFENGRRSCSVRRDAIERALGSGPEVADEARAIHGQGFPIAAEGGAPIPRMIAP